MFCKKIYGKFLALIVLLSFVGMGCSTPKPVVSTGFCDDPNPQIAAQRALKQAKKSVGKAPVKAVLFTVYYPQKNFTPESPSEYLPDTKAENIAAETIAKSLKKIPSIGLRAQAMNPATVRSTRGVSVIVFAGKDIKCKAVTTPLKPDRAQTGADLARKIRTLKNLSILICLSEMKLPFTTCKKSRPMEFLSELCKFIPADTTCLGASSMNNPADEKSPLKGKIFLNGKPLENQIAALGIAGNLRAFVDQRSEFYSTGKSAIVTKTQGRWILELDKKPALDVYKKLADFDKGQHVTADWKHPVAIVTSPGSFYQQMIINYVAKTGEDTFGRKINLPSGAIKLRSEIEPGTRLEILKGGDSDSAIWLSAKTATQNAISKCRLAKYEPLALFAMDCCSRGERLDALGSGQENDFNDGLRAGVSKPKFPLIGFFTFGQFGPVNGGFQDQPNHYQQHNIIVTIFGAK